MLYAILLFENRPPGPPEFIDSEVQEAKFSLEDVIKIAIARLEMKPLPGQNWTGFVRVVEVDSEGSLTARIVFEKHLPDKS